MFSAGATARLTRQARIRSGGRHCGTRARGGGGILGVENKYWTQAHLLLSVRSLSHKHRLKTQTRGEAGAGAATHDPRPRRGRTAKFTEVLQRVPINQSGHRGTLLRSRCARDARQTAEAATRIRSGRSGRAGTDDSTDAGSAWHRRSHHQARKYEKATINAAQALVNDANEDIIPRDALLMELGRVFSAAGQESRAPQTLDKVIAESSLIPPSSKNAKQLLSR